jgi:hypothetical protein
MIVVFTSDDRHSILGFDRGTTPIAAADNWLPKNHLEGMDVSGASLREEYETIPVRHESNYSSGCN